MAVIYITEANNTKHKFRLPTDPSIPVTIGRNAECLVSLPQIIGISGHHCTITLVDGKHIIKDENSTNGTLEGKRAISSEPLRAGATYIIGNACMTYDPERPLSDIPVAKPSSSATEPTPSTATASPALAEAAAAIGAGKKRKAVVSSALAEAAAAIGVKSVSASEQKAPQPAPEAENKPATADKELAKDKSADKVDEPLTKSESGNKADKPAAKEGKDAPKPSRRRRRRVHRDEDSAEPDEELSPQMAQLKAVLKVIYVLAVLGLAFYAGLTLRHWVETGFYLPSDTSAKS